MLTLLSYTSQSCPSPVAIKPQCTHDDSHSSSLSKGSSYSDFWMFQAVTHQTSRQAALDRHIGVAMVQSTAQHRAASIAAGALPLAPANLLVAIECGSHASQTAHTGCGLIDALGNS